MQKYLKKKVLKTFRWFNGNKNDIKAVTADLNGIRWKKEALRAFSDNKQNRMFLVKLRAYLNAFIRIYGKIAEPEVSDTIYQCITEYIKNTKKKYLDNIS